MLFCCHKYFYKTEKRYLLDTAKAHNQVLEFGTCPICGTLKACLTYEDIFGNTKEMKPKKKNSKQFINDCLNQPYYELKDLKVKYGTKNNMFWLFQSNGYIKDFNNETKGNCQTEITIKDTSIDALETGAFC